MPFSLSDLQYSHNGLEPIIGSETVRIHHTLHHQTYVNNLNNATNNTYSNSDLISVLQNPAEINNPAIRNNGGGHYNHALYWYILKPLASNSSSSTPTKVDPDTDTTISSLAVIQGLVSQFGSLKAVKEKMTEEGLKRFGSGWVWLCVDLNNQFSITTTPNQDNPIMKFPGEASNNNLRPIIGIDVWEHAYYLNYQNKRKDYLDEIWFLLNWQNIENIYQNSQTLPDELK